MMAFSTEEERTQFMTKFWVEPGTAMAHVRGTYLGAWGNEDALKADAAHILLREIRYTLERPDRSGNNTPGSFRMGGKEVTWEDVLRTNAFQEAFDRARHPNRTQLADAFTALAGENMNPDLRRALDYERSIGERRVNRKLALIEDRDLTVSNDIPDDQLAQRVKAELRGT